MSYDRVDAILKLENKKREEQLKMIWGWIKIGYINFYQFEELLHFVKDYEEDEWIGGFYE
jgi:hypothetical protein